MLKVLIQNLNAWDASVCIKMTHWQGFKPFDRLMLMLSFLGNGYLYVALILGVLILDPVNAGTVLPAGLISYAVGLTVSTLLKRNIRRARPCEILPGVMYAIAPQDKFSFPSGHTMSAFIAAVILSHFYPLLAIPVFGIASLIGISRVYNGVHYPGDVLAGILIGILSAQLGLIIVF